MKLLAATLSLVTFLGCATYQPGEKLALLATGVDLATTAHGLDQGLAEANPLLSANTSEETLALAVAVGALVHLVTRWALRDASPATQKAVWRAVASLRFGVSAWNISQIEGP